MARFPEFVVELFEVPELEFVGLMVVEEEEVEEEVGRAIFVVENLLV
jgi:hypothetical protein